MTPRPIALPPLEALPGWVFLPPEPIPVLPVLSEHMTPNDACIKRLAQLQLPPAEKIYPPPTAPGSMGEEVAIQTNVFGIEVHQTTSIYQYSISIKADFTPTKEVFFTKKGKEDFVVTDRREKCCSILFHAMEHNDNFFRAEDNTYVYDGQGLLFSTRNLFADVLERGVETRRFKINGADLSVKDLERFPCIKLEVFALRNPVLSFSQNDVGRHTSDSKIESVNRAYHQIIELALNQQCIRDASRCVVFEHGKLFFFKPLEEGYCSADCADVGDGKQMMPGIKKTVQFIEGPFGRGHNNPAVVIDGMKVAFHEDQVVLEKVREVSEGNVANALPDLERERVSSVIKGLDCYSTYSGRTRHLKIERLHHGCPATSRFELKNGGTSTVEEYFKDRHNIRLQYPHSNLIVCKQRGVENFYPMELMRIAPNQRVKISQQTSVQSQKTIKESAVLPDVRQRLIMTGKLAAGITANNRTLNDLGIAVCDEPLLVKARKLPQVRIAMQASKAGPLPIKDGKWRINQFLRAADPPKQWVLYGVGHPGTRFSLEDLKKIGEEFVTILRSKGVPMPNPMETGLIVNTEIEKKLERAAADKCPFAFCITDDSITNLHQKYKLIENKKCIVVQDMKMSKALSVIQQGEPLMLENVCDKTNVKLGGSNYAYVDAKGLLSDKLIIGVGVSQPAPGPKFIQGKEVLNPTIIGFAHNGKKDQEFAGDFALTPAGQETFAPIEDVIKESIIRYRKWHNDNCPKTIVVYRTGASESVNGSIMAYEIPLARSAIENFSRDIQLVYIVVSKDHTYRFFKTNMKGDSSGRSSGTGSKSSQTSGGPRACDMNIGPGLTLDTFLTNPACKQFFLNSHITLKGTAKTPLYTVLYDDANTPLDGLEDLTYNLCHLHQIVGLPTSLPTPLYVANEYAKRGRNLWNEAAHDHPQFKATGSKTHRLQEISNDINYKATGDFVDRRVNA